MEGPRRSRNKAIGLNVAWSVTHFEECYGMEYLTLSCHVPNTLRIGWGSHGVPMGESSNGLSSKVNRWIG